MGSSSSSPPQMTDYEKRQRQHDIENWGRPTQKELQKQRFINPMPDEEKKKKESEEQYRYLRDKYDINGGHGRRRTKCWTQRNRSAKKKKKNKKSEHKVGTKRKN